MNETYVLIPKTGVRWIEASKTQYGNSHKVASAERADFARLGGTWHKERRKRTTRPPGERRFIKRAGEILLGGKSLHGVARADVAQSNRPSMKRATQAKREQHDEKNKRVDWVE